MAVMYVGITQLYENVEELNRELPLKLNGNFKTYGRMLNKQTVKTVSCISDNSLFGRLLLVELNHGAAFCLQL